MTQQSNPILDRAAANGVSLEMQGAVAVVRLCRPAKRNALNDGLIEGLRDVFQNLPAEAGAAVIHGEGDHSRGWHVALNAVEQGRVPVVAALHGAVVGGGLELASASHIRVADESTFYALPEGTRGIFVGGGGSVRVPKLIGAARMTDMMLTGRVYNAQDGERVGFAQYLVPTGTALTKAIELATRIATNAPLTNFALMHALPRIAEQPADHGFFTEALISSIAQAAPEAKARVRAFLEGKAAKVQKAD